MCRPKLFVSLRSLLIVVLTCCSSTSNALSSPSRPYSRQSNIRMGLLKVGTPMPWEKSKKHNHYIRKAGVRQFISTYNRVKDLKGDELLFGDETEYGVFVLDKQNKKIRLCLRAKEIMDNLNEKEATHEHRTEGCNWVPEYGAWMVEATPKRPYAGFTTDLLRVERNMRLRRKRLAAELKEDEVAPTVAAFPLLGALGNDGSVPPTKVGGPITLSDYISDGIINPHPRFGTLSANIRQRRGEKVNIRIPLFRDTRTPEFEDFGIQPEIDGCCGTNTLQLWRYGRGDASRADHGNDYVVVGCSTKDGEFNASKGGPETLQKWLVNVEADGCRGLFYRSAPNVIVPDADWPRNGDVVVGAEIQDIPGWIRLQNGYYLPMASEDGKIKFLNKVSRQVHASNGERTKLGSSTPLLRGTSVGSIDQNPRKMLDSGETLQSLLDNDKLSLGSLKFVEEEKSIAAGPKGKGDTENLRAAIHMDAMAFGMGNCCLQITFQAKNLDESRFIYDQIAVLAPIMMALTASTPLQKGRIADTDCRWGIISECVDDRTPAERGLPDSVPDDDLAAKGMRRIYKPRYDSISTYIYQGAYNDTDIKAASTGLSNRILNQYNDLPVPVDQDSYEMLRKAGIDPALSQHIAHLFIRDPLVVFDGAVEEVDDETQTEHFESIQSTNWQSVRWKPPPPRNDPNDPHIGWRVEFRSMEMQLTDFENSAFTVFIVLLTRVILTFDLNLYIPLSRVDANMQRAHSRNASHRGKFYFRRHLAPLEEGDDGYGVKYSSMFSEVMSEPSSDSDVPLKRSASGRQLEDLDSNGVSEQRKKAPFAPGRDEENSYEEMTMKEIMTGKGDYFPGLIPLVFAYLDYIKCDSVTLKRVTEYLDFIEKRATGELLTPATWIRNFVRTHPDYKGDSVVSDSIAYDLMVACSEIGEGKRHEPELLGDLRIAELDTSAAWDVKMGSDRVNDDDILNLLRRYTKRASVD